MSNDLTVFRQFLHQYRAIPDADFGIIGQYLQYRDITAGTVLLDEGRIAKELFFVVSGILKIVSTTEKGQEVIQFFIKENRFCTILYSFNGGGVAHEGIVAATDASMLVFSRQDLETVFERLPYFKDLVGHITQQTLLDKIRARNNLMGEEATTRYLKFMAQQPDILQRVPLSDVASYLGITQQSLSRIRRNITL